MRNCSTPILWCQFEFREESCTGVRDLPVDVFYRPVDPGRVGDREIVPYAVKFGKKFHRLVLKVRPLVAYPEQHRGECVYPARDLSGRCFAVGRCARRETDIGLSLIHI